MSLQRSIEHGVSLGKDVVWFIVWGAFLCVFLPHGGSEAL